MTPSYIEPVRRLLYRALFPVTSRAHGWYWAERYRRYRVEYDLAPSFAFNGINITLLGSGIIRVGHRSYVGGNTMLVAIHPEAIIIGDRCSIAQNVRLDTHTSNPRSPVGARALKSGSIVIGDDVWIGVNVYIGPGITVGSGAVIGANSVVTRDVPPTEAVGGVPARALTREPE